MKEQEVEDDEAEDPDAWWDELPESFWEGIRAEQAMWERIQAKEAEMRKPRGLLGFLGYRTRTGVY